MIHFSPDQSLLESIESVQIFPIILLLPGYNENKEEDKEFDHIKYVVNIASTVMLAGLFDEAYRSDFEGENRQLLCVNMINEQVRNSAEHGNKGGEEKYITLAVWLGKKGIVFAYRDEGDYFSLPSTKKAFESRTRIESTRKNQGRGHGGAGTQHLFEVADKIIVAIEEKTLYATYLLR